MDIGTGIAIAGVWLFPSVCAVSKTVKNTGTWISIIVAVLLTIILRY